MFLLDSDTCIFFMKGDAQVNAHFKKHGPKAIFVSSLSVHELLYGALHSAAVERHLRVVSEFLAPLTVLPFSDSSAKHSSKIRQDLAAIGQAIRPIDTLIAGHALEHELTLVTGNTREFSRVPGLCIESWL
jgi:tRNA(fMet)-specific endonuclease VapC